MMAEGTEKIKEIVKNAIERHNLNLPVDNKDIEGLVSYCLLIGYNEGCKDSKEERLHRNNVAIESLNRAKMHIEGDKRLSAHASIDYAIERWLSK